MNPEDMGKITDIIPEKSRNALFESPLRSIGYALNGYLNILFGPLIELGAVQDAAAKSLAESVNDKTKNLTEQDLDRNKLGISLKAMDSVHYQIENESLREMFANLISKSINKHENTDASPLMVTTLSSMSPETAEFLINWHRNFPEGNSTLSSVDKMQMVDGQEIGSSPLLQNIIIFKDLSVYHNEYVVDELGHLGIFELHKDGNLTDKLWQTHYNVVEKIASTQYPQLQNATQKTIAKPGYIRLSPFGVSFIKLLID